MEQLAKFIIDERTGLKYELCGDYYVIAGEDEPKREPIGVGKYQPLSVQNICDCNFRGVKLSDELKELIEMNGAFFENI